MSLYKTRFIEDPHFDPVKIRNIFFELMVFLLRNYKDYFNPVEEEAFQVSVKKAYDFKSLKHFHKRDQFLQSFYETSLFSTLIETKLKTP